MSDNTRGDDEDVIYNSIVSASDMVQQTKEARDRAAVRAVESSAHADDHFRLEGSLTPGDDVSIALELGRAAAAAAARRKLDDV